MLGHGQFTPGLALLPPVGSARAPICLMGRALLLHRGWLDAFESQLRSIGALFAQHQDSPRNAFTYGRANPTGRYYLRQPNLQSHVYVKVNMDEQLN